MEAPRNYNNDSFFDVNNLFNFQDEEKLDGDLLFKSFSPILIDSEYEEKSNSIKEYAEEPISLTIKIGEKEIPITSFNCAKLQNVTKENLIEIENKIKNLLSAKQRLDLTMRINCARNQLKKAQEIPTIIVDEEEIHITCIGYGEYEDLSEEQLKFIKNRMHHLLPAERNKLSKKLYYIKTKESRNAQDNQNQPKEIPTFKIGKKEIPITSFNCRKIKNLTDKKLIEIENKIKYLPTPKQRDDLTMRINCAKELLRKFEKIPKITVGKEKFHITCIGYGEYENLTEKQLDSIENRMSHISYAKRCSLYDKLSKARKAKESRNAQDKQNHSNDYFKNKSIQTQDSLLEKNREQEEKSKPIEQDANNGLVQIDNYISDFFHSNTSNFFDSDSENHPESFVSSILALDTQTMTFNKEQNDQENQQTEVSLNQINIENPLSPLKSNFENNAEIFDFSILELDTQTMTFNKEQNNQENQQTENIPKKRKWWDAI